MGVSLNGGTPIFYPKMIIFSRKTHGLLGTTILGNPHIYSMPLSTRINTKWLQLNSSIKHGSPTSPQCEKLKRMSIPPSPKRSILSILGPPGHTMSYPLTRKSRWFHGNLTVPPPMPPPRNSRPY